MPLTREIIGSLPMHVVEHASDVASLTARGAAARQERHPSLRPSDAFVLATSAQRSADRLIKNDGHGPPPAGTSLAAIPLKRWEEETMGSWHDEH